MKTYSELCKFKTFEERFEYLKLGGIVGKETFGFNRYLNQVFIDHQNGAEYEERLLFVIMVVI